MIPPPSKFFKKMIHFGGQRSLLISLYLIPQSNLLLVHPFHWLKLMLPMSLVLSRFFFNKQFQENCDCTLSSKCKMTLIDRCTACNIGTFYTFLSWAFCSSRTFDTFCVFDIFDLFDTFGNFDTMQLERFLTLLILPMETVEALRNNIRLQLKQSKN